jgi:(1->4)-alpha-D-glucan 1-alpha-D-glucosylmutase
MRFQQLTGPVMAKGVEDTVFYRYLRFAAVNEVGGHPAHLGTDLGAYHAANELRQRDWPRTMLSTSTHDTKRSEDVRARLAVLSELPDIWVRTVEEWRALAAPTAGHTVRPPRTST